MVRHFSVSDKGYYPRSLASDNELLYGLRHAIFVSLYIRPSIFEVNPLRRIQTF